MTSDIIYNIQSRVRICQVCNDARVIMRNYLLFNLYLSWNKGPVL